MAKKKAKTQQQERVHVLYIRRIPRDIKDHFKAACAKRGVTMQKAIERLMKAFIKETQ